MNLFIVRKEVAADALRSRQNRAAITKQRRARPRALLMLFVLPLGCAASVTGKVQPSHFQFTTTVSHKNPGPGGWRVACVHAQINNGSTKEAYTCIFGVEMPLENKDGPISLPLAQRVSADCANEAAYTVLSTLTKPPPPPLYTLCTSIRDTYRMMLTAAIVGSKVKANCDSQAKPVVFGVSTPNP